MTTTFLRVPKHLLALGLLLAAGTARAQTTPAPKSMAISVSRVMVSSNTPPESRADEETVRLTGQLSLSPEQATQVRAAALAHAQARQAKLRRLEAAHAHGRIPFDAEDEAIEDQFEAQLQNICTPAQNQKYQTMHPRRLGARTDSLRRVAPAPASGGPK
jgi:protein CpxP